MIKFDLEIASWLINLQANFKIGFGGENKSSVDRSFEFDFDYSLYQKGRNFRFAF